MIYINGRLIVYLAIIGYLLIRGILIGRKYKKQIRVEWVKEVLRFLSVIYISMVVSVTLFPIALGFNDESIYFSRTLNLVPLASIIKDFNQIGTAYDGDIIFMISLIVRNVGGNILLLMPLGFLAPFLWNKAKSLKGITILGLVFSVTIELLQLLETLAGGWGRITDIDDVICNVLGVAIGFLVYIVFMRAGEKLKINMIRDLNT
ncbi:VanZ family protein [Robertmurraya yapensis]|uniref:VanZ family protein n=1 Tax=Bacillus yapensis TaxID=2492960 RepID=A0A3S0KWZ5_9BACI|nr:VanZ family protein [Bacillus yapensis]RTR36224.1 VanZ family protein [Bacillus yapensis]TKT05727.1 VanZ family protein [Bacillus yapensis]